MWASWALCFGIHTQTSHVWCGSKETQAWASRPISAGQMIFPASCICCRCTCHLCRHSAFRICFKGCWGPLLTWNWGRGGAWQDWPSTMLASRVSWEMLTRATRATRLEMALFTQAIFGEVSEETWKRISEETLRYYCTTLGLLDPEERNSLYFAWSNFMTSNSTIFSWRWCHLAPQLAQ